MATGRIGVTPTLRTRWSDQPTAGTTSLNGLDDNSVALVYDVGYEAVYRNGVLLSRGNDYTATDGTTVTLTEATIAGDIIEIFANQLVPLTDAISKGQYTAKGALLSATAASTPGVLAVGTNGQYLSADSTASTGLAWASVSAGANWSLLNSGGTALTGATTITVSGISGKDKIMIVIGENVSSANASSEISVRFNSDTGSNYASFGSTIFYPATYTSSMQDRVGNLTGTKIPIFQLGASASGYGAAYLLISGANAAGVKVFNGVGGVSSTGNDATQYIVGGIYNSATTISSISIVSSSGNLDTGTVYVYASA